MGKRHFGTDLRQVHYRLRQPVKVIRVEADLAERTGKGCFKRLIVAQFSDTEYSTEGIVTVLAVDVVVGIEGYLRQTGLSSIIQVRIAASSPSEAQSAHKTSSYEPPAIRCTSSKTAPMSCTGATFRAPLNTPFS